MAQCRNRGIHNLKIAVLFSQPTTFLFMESIENMTKKFFVCLLLLVGVGLTGCGDNHRLSGTVTFTDGKPVTSGMVLFTTPTFQAKGEIQADGKYVAGSANPKDGIPAGTYQVSLTGVTKSVPGFGGMPSFVPLCDEKYQNATSSGLTCTVPAPGNKYDLVLDPHPVNYP